MSTFRRVFFDWAPGVLLTATSVILLIEKQYASSVLIAFLSGFLIGFVLYRYIERH